MCVCINRDEFGGELWMGVPVFHLAPRDFLSITAISR